MPDHPTHAGGVVYWDKDGRVQYLLVSAKRNQREWVLPKGHIEEDETIGDAALREVREETGVVARLVKPVQLIQFTTDKEIVRAQFFLMERISACDTSESRRLGWFPLEKALELLTHHQSKEVLRAAEAQRSALLKE